MTGCPYIAGPACRDCDGRCWEPTGPVQPGPTDEDYCAVGGHAYYGDDGDGSEGTMGRCYCGAQTYPPSTTSRSAVRQ